MERQILSHNLKVSSHLLAVFLLWAIFIQPVWGAVVDSVVIISIPGNSAHQDFISAFRREYLHLDPEVTIIEQSADDYSDNPNRSFIVTLGSQALKETAHFSGRKFHALISHALYKEYYPEEERDVFHLSFNQPLDRILRLHSIALPESRNVGLLLSHPYPEFRREFSKMEEQYQRQIVTAMVGNDFSAALSSLLLRVSSVILLPDPKVINRATINSLVLDSYHKKVPLLGYSESLVKAGALLAIYSSSEQLGVDSAQLVARILEGKKVSSHNYPKEFKISVNYKLSRLYELTIPSEADLHAQVIEGEKK